MLIILSKDFLRKFVKNEKIVYNRYILKIKHMLKPRFHQEDDINKFDSHKYWGGITNPKEHNPESFRYLVHAFNAFQFQTQIAMMQMQNTGNPHINTKDQIGDQSINLQINPEKVAERVSVSMSLIDNNHLETFGNTGIIVGCPEDNIIAVDNRDMGTLNFDRKGLLERRNQNIKFTSGDDLLNSSTGMNEVVALGREGNKKLSLLGFFSKYDIEDGYIDEISTQELKKQAQRLGLPLVKKKFHDYQMLWKFLKKKYSYVIKVLLTL
ncbi:hypothetical protein CSB09_04735 [Candidatus Gracilibacteria bacterium]|nr:MAG: hypothetical protein CSB09_04735 [Candidatus Gracilibacteria bacterium]